MGKVTIILQTPKISSTELERMLHRLLNEEVDLLPDNPEADVFIVPDDEEFPDLS